MNSIKATNIIKQRKKLWNKHGDIDEDKNYVNSIAEYLIGPDGKDLRKEIQQSPEYLVEMCFVIVDKGQNTIPFFINTVQWEFLHRLNDAKAEFLGGKRLQLNFLILKGRQQG